MSEGRKRSRKSKLEVRNDDCEYEIVSEENDETTRHHLQKIPKLEPTHECPPAFFDHDYCKTGFQGFAYPYRPPTETPDSTHTRSTIIAVRNTLTPSGTFQLTAQVEAPLFSENNFSVPMESKPLHKKRREFYRRTIYKPTLRMFKYEPDMIFKISEEIVSSSQNPADKILDVEMRNLWGNVLHTPDEVDEHEAVLQKALVRWQLWLSASKIVRDNPLFYQCHICNCAWWRLQPFREHIRTHDIKTLKIILKENIHECMLIACDKPVTRLKFIDIKEDCWRCGNDLYYHRVNHQTYNCSRCKKSQYTCSALQEHELACLYYNVKNFNIAKERQCQVCKCYITSLDQVNKHMVEAHSVRSDLPVPITYKQCAHCRSKYFTYSTHNCSKSSKNASCTYCFRKFATKPLAKAHIQSPFNHQMLCRICRKPIESRCLEMQHMLREHSDNYVLAYKCTVCSDQSVLFLDEVSVRIHRQVWHQKKSDRRRSYFELMLVPKRCLQEGSVEELFEAASSSSTAAPIARDETHASSSSTAAPIARDETHDEIEFSTQHTNEVSTVRILTADIDVTVDEVDIKKEFTENGEIDYEEMLHNMFNTSDENTNKKETEPVITEFDFGSVQVKTEPLDEIDITENSIENVKIKTEPVDEMEFENQSDQDHSQSEIQFDETLVVKVESNIDANEINPEEIVIKTEKVEEEKNNPIPADKLITDLDMFKNDKQEISEKNINPDEMSFDVINTNGVYKKKRVYACPKCGYTAQHKQYKIHITTKCSVSPGINVSYPCTKCGLIFVMFRNYVLHFDNHGYSAMACPKCGVIFPQLLKLLSHVQKHVKGNFVGLHLLNKEGEEESSRKHRKVKCQECNEVVRHDSMFAHWEAHLKLKETPLKQPAEDVQVKEEPTELIVDCERVTINNKTLEPAALRAALDHLQSTSSNEKECVICYRVFTRRYDVKRHVVEHLLMDAHMKKSKYRAFRCQICSADFQHQEQYKFHMRDHGSMPIFKCELCIKTFSDSSNFAKHKKTHNVRVLICDICSKKFHSKSALEKHILEHSSNVPKTKCAFCDKVFKSKQDYKRHRYQLHVKNKFKCVLCDTAFSSLQQKWDHNWEVHKERKHAADCPICLKSFRKFHDVRVHARVEHRAEVCALKQTNEQSVQLYKVKDLDVKAEGETFIFYE